MALPINRPISERYLCTEIPDLSTASDTPMGVPARGYLKRVQTCINNAITTADATVTIKKNGTGTALGTITVAYSGSAQGDVDTLDLVPSTSTFFEEGDFVEITTDGGSSTTCRTGVICVFEDRG